MLPNVLVRIFDQISEIKHSYENVWQLIFVTEVESPLDPFSTAPSNLSLLSVMIRCATCTSTTAGLRRQLTKAPSSMHHFAAERSSLSSSSSSSLSSSSTWLVTKNNHPASTTRGFSSLTSFPSKNAIDESTRQSNNDNNSNNDDNNSNNSNNNSDSKEKIKEKKKVDEPNIFLDNLGKIFLSTIAMVLLSLLRSSKSSNYRITLRETIEAVALLDPLEIDDLRLANSDFTIDIYERIILEIRHVFSNRTSVTYPEFLSVVMKVMNESNKGEGYTIQFGHLIDRVIIAELERIAAAAAAKEREEGEEDEDERGEGDSVNEEERLEKGELLPLPFLLAALSLALHATVTDRVRVLYESAKLGQESSTKNGVGGGRNEGTSSTSDYLLSGHDASRMVQYLQRTCQLVPDAQIVETNTSIPYKTYRVGTGDELVARARNGYGGKKGSVGVTAENKDGPITLEEFHAILKSHTVCAWGECYIKKTGRIATSD